MHSQSGKITMDKDLSAALKAHRRRLQFHVTYVSLIVFLGWGFACWFFDLNGTQKMILFLGAMIIATANLIECRLKTIQVRLAWMHDRMTDQSVTPIGAMSPAAITNRSANSTDGELAVA
jgi:hypothetical protein